MESSLFSGNQELPLMSQYISTPQVVKVDDQDALPRTQIEGEAGLEQIRSTYDGLKIADHQKNIVARSMNRHVVWSINLDSDLIDILE